VTCCPSAALQTSVQVVRDAPACIAGTLARGCRLTRWWPALRAGGADASDPVLAARQRVAARHRRRGGHHPGGAPCRTRRCGYEDSMGAATLPRELASWAATTACNPTEAVALYAGVASWTDRSLVPPSAAGGGGRWLQARTSAIPSAGELARRMNEFEDAHAAFQRRSSTSILLT
jgi:hypothetical protein